MTQFKKRENSFLYKKSFPLLSKSCDKFNITLNISLLSFSSLMRYSLYFKSRRKYEVYSKNKDIFCVHLRILDVIIDKTLFLSMKTRKLSSSGISLPLFLAFISSWRKPENILKYCLRRSCFSGLPALRIIPSKVNLNFMLLWVSIWVGKGIINIF